MRHALLFSVFVIASCGLAYELIAGALSSYLLGDSVMQFSTVIGTYLFAMGVGSWLSKYITRDLIGRFIQIELMVGLLGGFSAIGLFLVFILGLGGWQVWRDQSRNAARAHADEYFAAQELIRAGNAEQAKAEFERLSGEGPRAYRAMAQARLREIASRRRSAARTAPSCAMPLSSTTNSSPP